jgi:alpha-glucosidase
MKPGLWRIAAVLSLAVGSGAQAQPIRLASGDGRTTVELATNSQGQLTFSLGFRGKQLLAPSALGLGFERYQTLSSGMAVVSTSRTSGRDSYRLSGKRSTVSDGYNELGIRLAETGGAKRRLEIVFRAYDDGIAFRYRLPAQENLRHLRLAGEVTEFSFPADYSCQAFNVGRYISSHEGEFDPIRASQMRAHHLFDLPVVCETQPGGVAMAFAEAGLSDYAALYFAGREIGDLGLQAKLSPRPDDPAVAVKAWVGDRGFDTPWRIIMVGDRAGDLVESTLVTSLAAPAQGDFSWVRPGKYAWDWWNGPTLGGKQAPMSTATLKTYIDFAAASGLEYMMIDEGWYRGAGGGATLSPEANNLEWVPAVDLPELVRYAADRKVGLWLWVHWKLLEANMDQALPLYAKLGIKGVKVDFMDRDDQLMVEYYHRLLRTAAANRLMVNLHGAFPPRGLNRTYPNFVTQEGVFGAEYNKWTRRVTARHNVNLALTRMLLGPMDYTPGGFRNATPATFMPLAATPSVQTTRGHGLAMYVVYDSPFQGVSDSPDNYRGQSGFDFVKAVPAVWDETRVVSAAFGEQVVIARRTGRSWYVGAMTNEKGRSVDIPLSFLGSGRYVATRWTDGGEPMHVNKDEQAVTRSGTLRVALAPSGGAALRFVPSP